MIRNPLWEVLNDIQYERERQFKLKEEGRFKYTPSDDELHDGERYWMIAEEMGEVSRNCLARKMLVTDGEISDAALYKELCQVAALSLAWMQRLDKGELDG